MKYFKNFFSFRNFRLLSEQATEVIGEDEFEQKARPKTKKSKLKLDYTKKYEQPEFKDHFWNGAGGQREGLPNSNYRKEWVGKIVKNAFSTDENKQRMVDGLKKYVDDKRPDYQTVKNIIDEEVKQTGDDSRLWYVIKTLATDGKVGPFHRIVANVISEEIKPIPPKDIPQDIPVEEEKPKKLTTGGFKTTEKTTTTDTTTGIIGEEEKLQKQFKVKGTTTLEKLLSLDYPSAEPKKILKSGEEGEEEAKDISSKLGEAENFSDVITDDTREISFDCNINRNDYLNKKLYVYVFYKRFRVKGSDKDEPDLGIYRRVLTATEKIKISLDKDIIENFNDKFVCNVIFSTEYFSIGRESFSKNPKKPFKISSEDPRVIELLNDLTSKYIKEFSDTKHKGPVYSTQRIVLG